jgi:PBP1b-binding outer membrane lipoprotein LpoB
MEMETQLIQELVGSRENMRTIIDLLAELEVHQVEVLRLVNKAGGRTDATAIAAILSTLLLLRTGGGVEVHKILEWCGRALALTDMFEGAMERQGKSPF